MSTDSAVILSNHLLKPSLPLPLIIAHQLSLYLALCKRKGLLESVGPAGLNAMQVRFIIPGHESTWLSSPRRLPSRPSSRKIERAHV